MSNPMIWGAFLFQIQKSMHLIYIVLFLYTDNGPSCVKGNISVTGIHPLDTMKVCTKLTCFRLDLNGETIERPTSRLTLLSIGVVLNRLNICVASGFCFILFYYACKWGFLGFWPGRAILGHHFCLWKMILVIFHSSFIDWTVNQYFNQ